MLYTLSNFQLQSKHIYIRFSEGKTNIYWISAFANCFANIMYFNSYYILKESFTNQKAKVQRC